MRITIIAISALLLFSHNAIAQVNDGAFFLRACSAALKEEDRQREQEDYILGFYCTSYASGFIDGMSLTTAFGGGRIPACLPEGGISNEQAARIFVKYLRANPEILHESGRSLLMASIMNAFPCKK